GDRMKRREFISLLGGEAASWPLAARAQQSERMRRIVVVAAFTENGPDSQARIAAFRGELQQLGWTDGRNVRIDYRWGGADQDRYRTYAAELVGLAPDVLLATNTSTVRALQKTTRSVPIVFATATDPIGGGLVASMSRPGGNITGFTLFEFGMSG